MSEIDRHPLARARSTLGIAIMMVAVCAAAVGAQEAAAPDDDRGGSNRPSIHAGPVVLEFPIKIQVQWQHLGLPAAGSPRSGIDLRRTRLAVAGTAFTRVRYEVEREFRDEEHGWRDVSLELDIDRRIHVTGGRFKIPFSLEQLTGVTRLDFARRSLGASYLAPGRDVGVMTHGTLIRGVKYQAGVFRRGGDNVRRTEHQDPASGPVAAGRLTVRPWQGRSASKALRGVTLGAAFTRGPLPEGLNTLRGHTIGDEPFAPRVLVNGARRRLGGEAEWRLDRAFVRSELIRVTDDRRGAGTDDQRLPSFDSRSWYLTAGWRLRGTRSSAPGSVEVAVRAERFEMGRPDGGAAAVLGAPPIASQGDDVSTLGLNWQVHRFVRLQANAIHERRTMNGVALPARSDIWSGIVRLQFSL